MTPTRGSFVRFLVASTAILGQFVPAPIVWA